MTKPSRPLSNGRDARSGSALRVESACMALKVAMPIRQIAASVPPVITATASPRRIHSAASPMALPADAHAETAAKLGPRAPNSMATRPAAMSGIIAGMVKGETRRGPISWRRSTAFSSHSRPPIPEATSTPTSSGMAPMSRPESVTASRASATPRATQREVRRSSLAPRWSTGSNPFTSPAMCVARSETSHSEMGTIPGRPRRHASQLAATSLPRGVTAPIPVTTTRTRPPTSRLIAQLLRGRANRGALAVEPAVDVEHLPCDRAGEVAEQEDGAVGDRAGVGAVPP